MQVAFNPAGMLLAAGDGDGGVVLWDTETRRVHRGPYHVHSASVNGPAFSPDGGTLASGGVDNRIVLWSIGSQLEWLLPRNNAQLVGRFQPRWQDVGERLVGCQYPPVGRRARLAAPAGQ